MSSKLNKSGQAGGGSYDFRNVLAGLILSRNDTSVNNNLKVSLVDFSSRGPDTTGQTAANGGIPLQRIIFYPCSMSSYSPHERPASVDKALNHGYAHRVCGAPKPGPDTELAESTGVPISDKSLRLSDSPDRLAHYGPVLPMYFSFIKKMIIYVLFLTLIFLMMIISSNEWDFFDYVNMMKKVVLTQSNFAFLVTATFLLSIIMMVLGYVFRRHLKRVKLLAKKSQITPSDYTLLCSNLGPRHTEDEIREFFSDHLVPGYSLNVARVSIAYNLDKAVPRIRKLNDIINQRKKAEEAGNKAKADRLRSKIFEINDYFNTNCESFREYSALPVNGCAFVTYNSKQECKSVRRKFQMSTFERYCMWFMQKCTDEFPEYFFKDRFIKVEKAYEVNEIIWENLESNSNRSLYLLISLIMMSCIATTTVGMIVFIKEYCEFKQEYVMGAGLFATNQVIVYLASWLAKFGRYKSMTETYIALGVRIAFMQLINITVPLMVVNTYFFHYSIEQISDVILSVCIMTNFLPIFFDILRLKYQWLKFKRRRYLNNQHRWNLSQEEANKLFEDPEIKIYLYYANIIRILLFACFFFVLSPGVAPASLLALLFTYWVDKYNIFNRHLMPSNLRSEIAETMFEYFDFSLVMLSLSNFIFCRIIQDDISIDKEVTGYTNTLSVFGLLLAVLYYILPNNRISRSCCHRQKTDNHFFDQPLLYQQALEFFPLDYWFQNPVFKIGAVPPEFTKIYKDTLEHYKEIEIINQYPELLTIFEYARKRPEPSRVLSGELSGLQNPYFIFPQNYGYGIFQSHLQSLAGDYDHRKASIAYDRLKKSTLIGGESINGPASASGKKTNPSKSIVSEAEMRDKVDDFDEIHAVGSGNSLMRDVMIFQKIKNIDKSISNYDGPVGSDDRPTFGTYKLMHHHGTTGESHQTNPFDGFNGGLSPITHEGGTNFPQNGLHSHKEGPGGGSKDYVIQMSVANEDEKKNPMMSSLTKSISRGSNSSSRSGKNEKNSNNVLDLDLLNEKAKKSQAQQKNIEDDSLFQGGDALRIETSTINEDENDDEDGLQRIINNKKKAGDVFDERGNLEKRNNFDLNDSI